MTLASSSPAPQGESSAKKRRGDGPLDRVLRALNHPVRRRILRALAGGRGSASTLSREFRMDLGVVSYHLNQVLAKECEVIEIVDTIPRRGAIEKFYTLRSGALKAAGFAPGDAAGGLQTLSPEECFIAAVEALDVNTFEDLEGSAWEWFAVPLDPEGWGAIIEARADFTRRVEAAVEASRARDGEEVRDVVVGAVAFPVPRPSSPPAG
jgi:DNA-binding transcriptional ArsR family regulator